MFPATESGLLHWLMVKCISLAFCTHLSLTICRLTLLSLLENLHEYCLVVRLIFPSSPPIELFYSFFASPWLPDHINSIVNPPNYLRSADNLCPLIEQLWINSFVLIFKIISDKYPQLSNFLFDFIITIVETAQLSTRILSDLALSLSSDG